MATKPCQVCSSNESKYKCPICRAASCSLACSQQHKENCLQPNPQQSGRPVDANPETPTTIESSSTATTLNTSDLKDLFQKYPSLRAELRNVYDSTRDPSERSHDASRASDGNGSSRQPWKAATGFENGLVALNRALGDGNPNSEAVAAFMKVLAEKQLG